MGQSTIKMSKGPFGFRWFCHGCNSLHLLPNTAGYDGFDDAPTFEKAFEHHEGEKVCRYHIVGGLVQYSHISDHIYRGRSIKMPFLPKEYENGAL